MDDDDTIEEKIPDERKVLATRTIKEDKIPWKALRSHVSNDDYKALKIFARDRIWPETVETKTQRTRYWTKWSTAVVENDQVFLVLHQEPPWIKDKDGTVLYSLTLPHRMQVIRESDIQDTLGKLYMDPRGNAGRSVASFYARISKDFVGINRADVETCVKNSATHQVFQSNKTTIVKPILEDHPMARLQMDLIDMSNLATHNNGVTFVLNIVDCFSKFLWSRPLKSKHTALVCSELQDVLYQEGPPRGMKLQSDNGAEFTSIEMKALCEHFGLEQRHSKPYSAQENGEQLCH